MTLDSRGIGLTLVLVAMLGAARSASAQYWGGCVDALDRPVPDYPNYGLSDIAVSHLSANGTPIIEYNPNVVLSVGSTTRRFFYLHECGHHALGQIVSGRYVPFSSEQAADCWAARQMRREGFSVDALRQVQVDVSRSPGDWSHLPGPQRALNLIRCLDQAEPSGADSSRGSCREITEYVQQTTMVTRVVPQNVPCQHCGCTQFGCGCLHPFDVVPVTVQQPVTQQVPVKRRVCD